MTLASIVSRLSVSRKLMLIYLLDLSAVIFITHILIEEKYIAINFARKETAGNHYISAVRDIQFSLARGLDSLGSRPYGQADAAVRREAAAAALRHAEAIRRAQALHGEGMNSAGESAALVGALESLAGAGGEGEDEADALHRRALAAGRELIRRIGDQSNMILDPDLDSYYTMSLLLLRYPELLDLVLQITDLAWDTSGTRPPTPDERMDFLVLEGRLAATVKGIASDLAAAYGGNPDGELRRGMEGSHAPLLATLEAVQRQLRAAVIEDRGGDHRQLIAAARRAALAATRLAWEDSSRQFDRLLDRRIEGFFQRMWLHLGTALGLLALILMLVFYVARQIVKPIRELAAVAEEVQGSNDYNLRARWQSSDEIGQLVRMFNAMLGRLDQERLIQQELAARERAASAQQELLEAIPLPLAVTRREDGALLHCNGPACELLQLDDARAGRPDVLAACLGEDGHARLAEALDGPGGVDEFEVRLAAPDGSRAWALLSARLLSYRGEAAVLSTFTPINARKEAEEQLRLWAKVFQGTSESIMITDAQGKILSVNTAFTQTTGFSAEEALGGTPALLRSSHHDRAFYEAMWEAVLAAGSWKGEIWNRRKDGEIFPAWLVINAVTGADGRITNFIALLADISERKAQQQRIEHLAHHDALTGLPNRALCRDRLAQAMEQAGRNGDKVAAIFIDLDRFKTINDSLGHHVGDELLQTVAMRLSSCLRGGDTVSRLGGDEFVMILVVHSANEAAYILERRVLPTLRQPCLIGGTEIRVSCSVGISLFPDDGRDIDILFRNADAAMYEAKSNGRNNYQFFTEELNARAFERLNTENNLRHALERQELVLHYQPQVDARSRRLVGVEALLRWRHPDLGLIPPARFIPVAEESGLIVPIGEWVIREACRQHVAWIEAGLPPIPVAVNISAVQFLQAGLAGTVRAAIAESGIEPECLELELTESVLMEDAETTIRALEKLKAMRVRLAIDDFGTGYSSLNYLRRLPVTRLKIDQTFVRDMLRDPADLAIIKAIIGLGHTLGMRVLAEGVENEEEFRALRAGGCDEMQGYAFARPMAAGQLARWLLEDGPQHSPAARETAG